MKNIFELYEKIKLYNEKSLEFDNLMNDFYIEFNQLSEYDKLYIIDKIWVGFCGLDDYSYEFLYKEFNSKIHIVKYMKKLDDDNDKNIFYDKKDIGFYVRYKDLIFKVSNVKKDNTEYGNYILFDIEGNEYNRDECVALTKKELRKYKISLL